MLAASVLAASVLARGQETAKPEVVRLMANDADPDWEVATVRESDPESGKGQQIDLRGRHVVLSDTTVEQFLLLGYGVQKSQLVGVPEWARTVRWTVAGVPDKEGKPNWPQLQALIRKILLERFGLEVHRDRREMPVFALTVAKGGTKLVVSAGDPNGLLSQRNGDSHGRHVEVLKNASIVNLAEILQFHLDRPVIDQTGLKGRYDLKLEWTVDEAAVLASDAPPGLFTAIQDQVGLKLERVKAAAEVLIIEKVERAGAN